MRFNEMNRLRPLVVALAIAMTLPFAAAPVTVTLFAQSAAPQGTGNTFKDTSMIKPPAGARVAIFELEDLECPACAHAFPIIHSAMAHYNIPLVHKDFPLSQHIWSRDAAVWARYLQDKVSPKTADDYRGAVFSAQTGIGSKDDMLNLTRKFFKSHGLNLPFVVDPTGQLSKEVQEDHDLGERLGLQATPTIFVCSQHEWVQVTDVSVLFQTIEAVKARAGAEPAGAKKAATPVKKAAAKN